MLGIVTAVIVAALGAALTGPVQAWSARYIRRIKQHRALGRLRAEPLYQRGAKIKAAYGAGVGEPLFIDGTIGEMSVGRVLIQFADGSHLPMTCAEFESLQVVMAPRGAARPQRSEA